MRLPTAGPGDLIAIAPTLNELVKLRAAYDYIAGWRLDDPRMIAYATQNEQTLIAIVKRHRQASWDGRPPHRYWLCSPIHPGWRSCVRGASDWWKDWSVESTDLDAIADKLAADDQEEQPYEQ